MNKLMFKLIKLYNIYKIKFMILINKLQLIPKFLKLAV